MYMYVSIYIYIVYYIPIGDLSKHRRLSLRCHCTGAFYQKINYAATVNVTIPYHTQKPFLCRPRDVYRITIILPQITPGRSSNRRGLNQIKTPISYLLKTQRPLCFRKYFGSTRNFLRTWYNINILTLSLFCTDLIPVLLYI